MTDEANSYNYTEADALFEKEFREYLKSNIGLLQRDGFRACYRLLRPENVDHQVKDLEQKLLGAYSTIFARSLAKAAADAIRQQAEKIVESEKQLASAMQFGATMSDKYAATQATNFRLLTEVGENAVTLAASQLECERLREIVLQSALDYSTVCKNAYELYCELGGSIERCEEALSAPSSTDALQGDAGDGRKES